MAQFESTNLSNLACCSGFCVTYPSFILHVLKRCYRHLSRLHSYGVPQISAWARHSHAPAYGGRSGAPSKCQRYSSPTPANVPPFSSSRTRRKNPAFHAGIIDATKVASPTQNPAFPAQSNGSLPTNRPSGTLRLAATPSNHSRMCDTARVPHREEWRQPFSARRSQA